MYKLLIVDNAVCNDYLDNALVHHISDFSEKYPNPWTIIIQKNLHKLQQLSAMILNWRIIMESSKEILSIMVNQSCCRIYWNIYFWYES